MLFFGRASTSPYGSPPPPVPRPLLGLCDCPSQGLRDVAKKKGTRSAKLDMLLKMVVLSLLLLLLAVNTASLAKIAGFAAVGGSGYINMRNIMEELASRGHEVHWKPVVSLTSRFANGRFANVPGQFANV